MDWAALALLIYEAPSILLSQDRANSIGATEVVALSMLAYLVARLDPLRPAATRSWIGAAWIAC